MNSKPSILFLGAGKRVSLINEFIIATKTLNVEVNILAYELDQNQPISLVSKIITGLKWSDSDACSDLFDLIHMHNVTHVISCVDPAIEIAEKLNQHINKETADTSNIQTCLNKNRFQVFCEKNGLPIIPKVTNGSFPVFAKPATGSASIGAQVISSERQLKRHDAIYGPLVIQKILTGPELTIDCFVTKEGRQYASPRIRTATAGGEVVDTELVEDDESRFLALELLSALKITGPATVQVKLDENGNKYLMECNPRYGGGVLCTFASGLHYPTLHCADIFDIPPPTLPKRNLLRMKRYFQEVYYEVNH